MRIYLKNGRIIFYKIRSFYVFIRKSLIFSIRFGRLGALFKLTSLNLSAIFKVLLKVDL